jgi:hypothetical protein
MDCGRRTRNKVLEGNEPVAEENGMGKKREEREEEMGMEELVTIGLGLSIVVEANWRPLAGCRGFGLLPRVNINGQRANQKGENVAKGTEGPIVCFTGANRARINNIGGEGQRLTGDVGLTNLIKCEGLSAYYTY